MLFFCKWSEWRKQEGAHGSPAFHPGSWKWLSIESQEGLNQEGSNEVKQGPFQLKACHMYPFRGSFIQQLDKRLFSFAFGLWGLTQQECGMCLQGSGYCWNMWALVPAEISEDWDCTDSGCTSWAVRVDVGEETGLWVCSQSPAKGKQGKMLPFPTTSNCLPTAPVGSHSVLAAPSC